MPVGVDIGDGAARAGLDRLQVDGAWLCLDAQQLDPVLVVGLHAVDHHIGPEALHTHCGMACRLEPGIEIVQRRHAGEQHRKAVAELVGHCTTLRPAQAGQAALRRARVLVVGAGGLGAPVCLYLAAAGVGRITLADDDRVGLSNLQRQVIFRGTDAGRPKAQAARDAMLALNPHVRVTALERRITDADAGLIAEHDLVIDGTDTFAARQAINAACVAAGVPLIAGAIAQWEGQLTVWDPRRGAPCMACIFPEAPAPGLAPACAEAGVVGPLPGVIGSMMALEAIKIIAGAGDALRGRMLIFDGLYGENRVMKIARRDDCAVCGSGHSRLG